MCKLKENQKSHKQNHKRQHLTCDTVLKTPETGFRNRSYFHEETLLVN